MSQPPVRFAVVGLGMGVSHCADVRDARGCELVLICDTEPDRLRQTSQKFGVRGTASFDEVLADPEVDVVNVCTPSGSHAEFTMRALRAGKHVVCEKPPDVTVEAVDRMIAAKNETGKKLMVIFQSRFEPVYIELRRAIRDGELGKLVGVHGTCNWWRAQSYFNCPGMWKGTWKLDGGGSLANQGVHTLDILQWLAGPVSEVYGRFGVFAHDIETEDKTVVVLTFANGALGSLTTTTAAYPGLDRTVWVHGSKGSIVIEDDKLTRWRIKSEDAAAEDDLERRMLDRFGRREKQDASVASDPFAFATRGHLLQFEALVDSIHGDTAPPNPIESTRHTIELLNAIYRSGRENRPVKIEST